MRVFATLKLASVPSAASSTTWDSAARYARSTLADANESRDWRIYADFAQVLIAIARPLYALDPIGVDLDQSLYALDSPIPGVIANWRTSLPLRN